MVSPPHPAQEDRSAQAALHGAMRKYLPELIYGANDGIVTTFAIVSGVVGADLLPRVVLILGVASLVADGFSMAASAYLSEMSQPGQVPDRQRAIRRGVATLIGFLGAGGVPLVAYLVPMDDSARFWVAGALTLATLFLVGALRSLAAEAIQWFRGGLEMLIVGAAAAGVAYWLGSAIASLTGQI